MRARRSLPAALLATLLALLPAASASAARFPVAVRGADEASFTPPPPAAPAAEDPEAYDAVVVGGGLSGLTAALFLSDAGKKVLVLEKLPELGGLAAGGERDGVAYDRGSAYWTSAYDEELKILERLGISDYKGTDQIHEPSDSYLWNGKLYLGLWEEETLAELPASFALFRSELVHAFKAGLLPNQPLEEAPDLLLDSFDAAEWVRRMPLIAASRADPESARVYQRFLKDPTVDRTDPMTDVLALLDSFCRSALGTTAEHVSALAFGNFYISEIEPRFTTPVGTGKAARRLEALLRERPALVTLRTEATATAISQSSDGVAVAYLHKGQARMSRARYAVYAAQLKFAPRIVAGLAEKDRDRATIIAGLDYADFSVHPVFVKGHPYRATYDTWFPHMDGEITDVILGRWMDPKIRGYEGLRDFKKQPPDQVGILTLYHPHPHHFVGKGYTKEQAEDLAVRAVDRAALLLGPVLKERWGSRIEVSAVETNRWPFSIHIAAPGHFSRSAKLLRRPFGRVFFGHNNLGTPAFEEALFRGHCAANNLLKRLDTAFQQEPWTRCPLEP